MTDFIKLGDLIRQITAPGENPAKRNWRLAMQSQVQPNPPKELGPIQRQAASFDRSMRQAVEIFRTSNITLREAGFFCSAAFINLTLADCNGNQCQAAKLLRIHRNTLARRIEAMRSAGVLTANLRGPGNFRRRKSVQREKAQARDLGVKVGSA